MAQVRALTTLVHDSRLYKPGDVFEYADEMAKQLTGHISEGLEVVNKKSTAAFEKAKAEAHQALVDTAASLRHVYDELKGQLDADPSRMGLTQLVLDAETAYQNAEAEVAKASEEFV
ncbi:hypothetical protein AAKU67_002208 [Oxalobacteraceae bacterium GrIS 2.11]